MVEAHSGKTNIESRAGHGTEVVMELPERPLQKNNVRRCKT